MIHEFECLACGAVYSETTQEGATYHHACAPVFQEPTRKWILPADGRDERIVTDREGGFTRIVSEGKGVRCITDQRIPEPVWLTRRKIQHAAKWRDDND